MLTLLLTAALSSPPTAWHEPGGLKLLVPLGAAVELLDADAASLFRATASSDPIFIPGEGTDPLLRVVRIDGKPMSLASLFPAVDVLALLPPAVSPGLPVDFHVAVRPREGHDAALGGVRGFLRLDCAATRIERHLVTDEAGVARPLPPAEAGQSAAVMVPLRFIEAAGGDAAPTHCELSLSLGGALIDGRAKLVTGTRALLSADRPIYRPGDTVHARALMLDRATSRPRGKVAVALSLSDDAGTVIARETRTTSDFGLAHATLVVPPSTRGAKLTLEAKAGEASASRSLDLGQFVKAGLEVALTAPKSVRPGTPFTVELTATRLDGGAAGGADVELRVGDTLLRGRTEATGRATFGLDAPKAGSGALALAARVETQGGQLGRAERAVAVVAEGLTLYAIPESGVVPAAVPSAVWGLVVDGEDRPAAGVAVSGGGASCSTDAQGICRLALEPSRACGPAGGRPCTGTSEFVRVSVAAKGGGVTHRELKVGEGALLSLDEALLEPGRPIRAHYRAAAPDGAAVRLELLSDSQALCSTASVLSARSASLELEVPRAAAGTLLLRALHFDGAGRPLGGDVRLVLVSPPGDIDLTVSADQAVYGPRDTAALTFRAKDRMGRPAIAALSAVAVDKGLELFGLEQPGIERAVARLGPSWAKVETPVPDWAREALLAAGDRRRLELLASAAALSLELPKPSETGPERLTAARRAFTAQLQRRADALGKALSTYYREKKAARGKAMTTDALIAGGAFAADQLVDPWGLAVRPTWKPDAECCEHGFELISAGADGRFGTADDVAVAAEFSGWAQCKRRCVYHHSAHAGFGTGTGAYSGVVHTMRGVARAGLGAPPLREWFPDTLAVLPELITGEDGTAEWRLPLADALTTWRIDVRAVAQDGGLGAATLDLPVRQPIAVDAALEPELVLGDTLVLPVEVRNGTASPATFSLTTTLEGAASLESPLPPSVDVPAGGAVVLPLSIRAARVGPAKLTLDVRGPAGGDRVRRAFVVVGGGVPTESTREGVLASPAAPRGGDAPIELAFAAPAGGIRGTERVQLRLYGGVLGAAVEGLDALLAMPSGCFEQTSATTYPNALVLDYLKRRALDAPEVATRAKTLLEAGWERLKGYEVQGGGFSWFGDAPANQVLTAFGLMEFEVMGRHMPLDAALLARTRKWLLAQRSPEGFWKPDAEYLHAEAWSDVQSGALPVTAYITWALLEAGEPVETLAPSLAWLEREAGAAKDPYTRSVVALALATAHAPSGARYTAALADTLSRSQSDAASPGAARTFAHLSAASAATVTHAGGDTATLETTALAALALLGDDRFASDGDSAVEWLLSKRQAGAGWGSTQATILALEALLERDRVRGAGPRGQLTVTRSGAQPTLEVFTKENADVVRLIDLGVSVRQVGLAYAGEGEVRFQLGVEVERSAAEVSAANAPLTATLELPTAGTVGQPLAGTLTLVAREAVAMPLVTLALPAATELDVAALRGVPGIDRVERVGRRVEIYARRFESGTRIALPFRLTPRRSGTLHGGATLAQPYYQPERRFAAAGPVLVISEPGPSR